MIYLDNSATSFPKPKGMADYMAKFMDEYCGNPGRSGYTMSLATGEKIFDIRNEIAEYMNVNADQIVFTSNTTHGLNIAIFGGLSFGDHVITTSMEHNSVLRPLHYLKSKGIEIDVVKGDNQGNVQFESIKNLVKENTRMIIMTHCANTTGIIEPIREVGRFANAKKILFLVDGAQAIGHMDVKDVMPFVDMYAFPGHKGLLGPMGTGGLYIKRGVHIRPLLFGGTGSESKSLIQPGDLPDSLESGTINAPGIIGLGYSLKIIKKIGTEAIVFHEQNLIKYLEERLRNMNRVTLYGPEWKGKGGITLLNLKERDSEEVVQILSRDYNIAVRGGYHCAGQAHKTIGTWDKGAVRISVGIFNTRRDMIRLIDAVKNIE